LGFGFWVLGLAFVFLGFDLLKPSAQALQQAVTRSESSGGAAAMQEVTCDV